MNHTAYFSVISALEAGPHPIRMCYLIYISTTSQEDFGQLLSEHYNMLPITDEDDPAIIDLLDYPERWYLQCRYGGCSCHFRHLCVGNEMEFSPPEDWSPEDTDDIEATATVYDLLSRMLAEGHKVDLIDVWVDTEPEAITAFEVCLSEVDRDSFRFFENHRFNLNK